MSVRKINRDGAIKLIFKERYYSKDIEYYPFFHKYVDSESGKTVACLYFSAVSRKNYTQEFFGSEAWKNNGILIWCKPI